MRQETAIQLLAYGFCRQAMKNYVSNYCRLYYSKTGEFEGMDIGIRTLDSDDLSFPLKNTLDIINKAVKKLVEDEDRSFFVLAELDPIETIKIAIVFKN